MMNEHDHESLATMEKQLREAIARGELLLETSDMILADPKMHEVHGEVLAGKRLAEAMLGSLRSDLRTAKRLAEKMVSDPTAQARFLIEQLDAALTLVPDKDIDAICNEIRGILK